MSDFEYQGAGPLLRTSEYIVFKDAETKRARHIADEQHRRDRLRSALLTLSDVLHTVGQEDRKKSACGIETSGRQSRVTKDRLVEAANQQIRKQRVEMEQLTAKLKNCRERTRPANG